MKICHPLRLLFPVSASFFAAPFVFPNDLNNIIFIPIFYFFGIYFLLLNFPEISEMISKRPIYIEDLILATADKNNSVFKNIYNNTMNFILSIIFTLFSTYIITGKHDDKPIVEILGIIGGNLILYIKIQHIVGRILINFCHCIKEHHEIENNIQIEPSIDIGESFISN